VVFAYTNGPVIPERTIPNDKLSISVTFGVIGNA